MVFMRKLERNPRVASVFTSIVNMAHSLGIPVIAEGVETQEQYEFLHSVGCDYAQGYYCARPMDPDAFEAHVDGR